MSILHLCNTFFEWELAGLTPKTLEGAFSLSPLFLQLQFLPLLYAKKEEALLVSEKTDLDTNLSFFTFDENPPYKQLETWGSSQLAKEWADKRGIFYEIPPWDVVRKINSKAFSFAKCPLPGAKLLHSGDKIPQKYLLKTCFGTAGRGHLFSSDSKALDFCMREWNRGFPVIGEPWVEREVDFSTQWKITQKKEVSFLGLTFCQTNQKGAHLSNIVGDKKREHKYFTQIETHKTIVQELLQEIAEMGYFGFLGIDAMIYDNGKLQPIVEINGRKTMGLVALLFQKKYHPHKRVELAYIPSSEKGPLPSHLGLLKFSRQVIITIQ